MIRSFRDAAVFLTAASLFWAVGAATAGAADGGPIVVSAAKVSPRHHVPASVRPIRIRLRLRAEQPRDAVVRIRRAADGKIIRRIPAGRARAPARWHRRSWDGRDAHGRLAAPGGYAVLAGPTGGPFHRVARLRLHGHRYPVAGPHGVRGAVGEFGAGRNGGRIHQGFDVTARCGTPLVAVRSGRILRVGFDPSLYGNYVVLKGEGERRTYKYAHLREFPLVSRGQTVRAGRRFGVVGQTGNAWTTPCHLHIEIRSRGRLLDPWPLLSSWDG